MAPEFKLDSVVLKENKTYRCAGKNERDLAPQSRHCRDKKCRLWACLFHNALHDVRKPPPPQGASNSGAIKCYSWPTNYKWAPVSCLKLITSHWQRRLDKPSHISDHRWRYSRYRKCTTLRWRWSSVVQHLPNHHVQGHGGESRH